MKKVFLCLFFLFFVSIGFGQANLKLDSLKRILAKLPAEGKSFAGDTLRVNVLCEMGEFLLKDKKEEAFNISKEAIRISEKIGNPKSRLSAYLLTGKYFHSQSLNVKSTEYFLKALALAENQKIYKEQIFLTVELGSNYYWLKDYSKAMRYFLMHKNLSLKYDTKENYFVSFNNIGIVFFELNKFQDAINCFQICENGGKDLKSNKLRSLGLINIATVFKKMGLIEKALQRFNLALTFENGYSDRIGYIKNQQAEIYLEQKKYDSAIEAAKFGIDNCPNKASMTIKALFLTISKAFQKTKNLEMELFYYKKFSEMTMKQDSIKTNQLVRFMDLDYKSEKQSILITNLNSDVKIKEIRNRNLIIGLFLAIGLTTLLIFFTLKFRNQNKKINQQNTVIMELNHNLETKVNQRTYELSAANKELVLKNFEITEALYRGQSLERKRVAAELHDNLGGTLSALKWRLGTLDSGNLSEKEKAIYESICYMMTKAYEEVRNISHNLLPEELEKKGLEGALKKFVNELNESGKITFVFKTEGDFSKIDKKVALELYSVVMEMINNILKHSRATEASIFLMNRTNKIIVKVNDNGIGLKSDFKEGKGLVQIQERVRGMGGFLEVKNTNNNLQFSIEIPNNKF